MNCKGNQLAVVVRIDSSYPKGSMLRAINEALMNHVVFITTLEDATPGKEIWTLQNSVHMHLSDGWDVVCVDVEALTDFILKPFDEGDDPEGRNLFLDQPIPGDYVKPKVPELV